MAEKSIKLKVAEAIQDDVNKGIVRVDSSFMHEIAVKPGDIVQIKGKRPTVGIVDRAYPGDIGLNIIRMDGLIRRNAQTGIGEPVEVTKAEVKEAKKIIIAPATKGIHIGISPPNILKHGLLGRAVVKGDIVSLGGTRRRRSTMEHSPFFEEIISSMFDDRAFNFGFADLKFIVADTNPKMPVVITEMTEVELNPEAVDVTDDKVLEVTYEDIGGLDEDIKKIREMVELPLKHPEIFERLGIEAPKGVLLHGPPGTGKTLLAKAVANETNSNFSLINGPEIMSKYYGQSEENLRKKFEDAEKNAPSIIFIDEIDAIASKREEAHGEVERRVVAQLLALMDGLKSRGKVVVIAASNIPNALDPALRRPGRFDREIEIGVPSKAGRLDILKIHTRNMPLTPSTDISSLKGELNQSIKQLDDLIDRRKDNKEEKRELDEKRNDSLDLKTKLKGIKTNKDLKALLASDAVDEKQKGIINELLQLGMLEGIAHVTHGFVGADLAALAKEAAMNVLRRVFPDLRLDEQEPISQEILQKLVITSGDFNDALKAVRPSALREVMIEKPNVKWNDIGGLEGVKQELKEAVEWPLNHPEAFKRLGVRPPKGVLLYGAPGTGKTLLAKAVANESASNFILVKGPELISKWVGESEKGIRRIFHKARQTAPTIIFFDEIDSIAQRRGSSSDNRGSERVVNQLLTEMDGLEDMADIVVMAATNRPDILDTALLRPGRFDRIIHTPVPDEKARLEIFKVHTKEMPLEKTGKDDFLKGLAKGTEGYAGADIEAVCREAAMLELRENIKADSVRNKHFEDALKKVKPSVTKEIAEAYSELQDFFRSAKAKEMKEEKPSYMG
ncbi:MAG: CDC48 family AAA ATPase [Nanoarchaeota archaeon]|nr:CDC48 family AAA ATPase [Nanoarchaeota archaeon]